MVLYNVAQIIQALSAELIITRNVCFIVSLCVCDADGVV